MSDALMPFLASLAALGVLTGCPHESESLSSSYSPESQIREVVSRNARQFKYCYNAGLNRNEALAGRIEVEWTIMNGRVTATAVVTNTTGDTVFAECIAKKIANWSFPATITDTAMWPFTFRTYPRTVGPTSSDFGVRVKRQNSVVSETGYGGRAGSVIHTPEGSTHDPRDPPPWPA